MSVLMRDDEPAEKNLRDRLQACQQSGLPGIPVNELLRYIREVAERLDALHSQDQLYRDLKPDNILLHKGHARLAELNTSEVPLSVSAGSGTPTYVAPEVFLNQSAPESDQYSLAISYAEMRFGRRPLSGKDLLSMMLAHLEGTPDLATLPETEERVLLKALAKQPGQRYPSCLDFVQVLERVAVS